MKQLMVYYLQIVGWNFKQRKLLILLSNYLKEMSNLVFDIISIKVLSKLSILRYHKSFLDHRM